MISSIQDGFVALVVSGAVATGGFLFSHGTDIAVLEEKETQAQLIQKELVIGVREIQINNVKFAAEIDKRLALLEAKNE